MLLADEVLYCLYVTIVMFRSLTKGSFLIDLKMHRSVYTIRKWKFDDCKMVLPFQSSGLSVVLALFPSLLFVTGLTLSDEIVQIGISFLKMLSLGKETLFEYYSVLPLRTRDVDFSIANS